jgi:tetratricopeptide (TPR) repeat protein
MMSDIDSVKQTVDILERSDLLDEIVSFMEMFEKHKLVPKDILGYDLYCYCYNKAKKFHKAIEYGEKALSLAKGIEQQIAVKNNVAKIYLSANQPIKAKEYYEFILKHVSNDPAILLDYSASLFACNLKDKSYQIIKKMEENLWKYDDKMSDSILFNLGVHYIQQGDFRKGMEHLNIGRKLKVFGSYSKIWDIPEWNGVPKKNMHILMAGEGGIGDEIINARFVKHLKDMGMRVSIATTHKVKSIYSHLGFEKNVDYADYNKKDYDCWTPMMALPKTLNLDFSDLWHGPYLQAKPNFIEKHKEKITGKFKVGLRWAGNPRYDHELHRSLNLKSMLKCLPESNDWSLYSIQRDVALDQLKDVDNVVDLNNDLSTFEDLLGVLDNLDLIITSCTSVGHAAAALGKKVIIMIPIMEYYTWAEGNPTSSWYGDNLRLIRQDKPQDWTNAYIELKNVLRDIK